jgi:hypothetical protein
VQLAGRVQRGDAAVQLRDGRFQTDQLGLGVVAGPLRDVVQEGDAVDQLHGEKSRRVLVPHHQVVKLDQVGMGDVAQ